MLTILALASYPTLCENIDWNMSVILFALWLKEVQSRSYRGNIDKPAPDRIAADGKKHDMGCDFINKLGQTLFLQTDISKRTVNR